MNQNTNIDSCSTLFLLLCFLYLTEVSMLTSLTQPSPAFLSLSDTESLQVLLCNLSFWYFHFSFHRCHSLSEAPKCTSSKLLELVSWLSFSLFHCRKAVQGPEVQQQPVGQEESELSSDRELEGSLTLTSYQNQQGGLSPLSASGKKCTVEEIKALC